MNDIILLKDRPELSPNICAVYVEEKYRGRGIAKAMLDRTSEDMFRCGIKCVYLITEHTGFYEKCGRKFYGTVEEIDGSTTRMYYKKSEE